MRVLTLKLPRKKIRYFSGIWLGTRSGVFIVLTNFDHSKMSPVQNKLNFWTPFAHPCTLDTEPELQSREHPWDVLKSMEIICLISFVINLEFQFYLWISVRNELFVKFQNSNAIVLLHVCFEFATKFKKCLILFFDFFLQYDGIVLNKTFLFLWWLIEIRCISGGKKFIISSNHWDAIRD